MPLQLTQLLAQLAAPGGALGYPSAVNGGASSSSSLPYGANTQHSLIEEWKARDAAAAGNSVAREMQLRDFNAERARLLERIDWCGRQDSRWWPERSAMQLRVAFVEQQLQQLSHMRHTEQQVVIEKNDKKYGKFSMAVTLMISKSPEQTVLMSHVDKDQNCQREWKELILSRIIRKSTTMKEVLLERPALFQIYNDAEGRAAIRFPGGRGTTDKISMVEPKPMLPGRPALPAPFVRPPQPVPLQVGLVLPGERPPVAPVLALQGAGQVLAPLPITQPPMLGPRSVGMVMEVAPISHEKLQEVEDELMKAGGSDRFRRLCLHVGVQEEQMTGRFRFYEENGKTMVTHLLPERARLEGLLLRLSTDRCCIAEAMVHCMDHAAQHAAVLARVLVRSLEVLELQADRVLAGLFLVSDVLHNSSRPVPGAAKFRGAFEELLPDAFERLGRSWLPPLGCAERGRALRALRSLFAAWRAWDVYPSVFVNGLEALLLAPVSDFPLEASEESDLALRQKLEGWLGEEPASVRKAACYRGLATANMPIAVCHKRLAHYERYWHVAGAAHWAAAAAAAAAEARPTEDEEAELGSVDGDPLDEGDFAELAELAAETELAGRLPRGGQSAAKAPRLAQAVD